MDSTPSIEEPAREEETTLLEVLKSARDGLALPGLGRMALAARTVEKKNVSAQAVSNWISPLVKKAEDEEGGSEITGMLLVWPNCTLIVFEGTFSQLKSIVRSIKSSAGESFFPQAGT